jgi:2-hydroxychromene-2-carboxylate isomerase
MVPIVAELGLSALGLTERAQSEPIKTGRRDQTEQARAKGIFGAPTFFVGTEMFWGNDRLDDALLFAAKQKV